MTAATPSPTSACPLCGGSGHYDYSSHDMMLGGDAVYYYHRCEACGLVYQQPLPDIDTIGSFYPSSYGVHQAPKHTGFSAREVLTLRTSLGYEHLPAPKLKLKHRLRGGKPVTLVPRWRPGGRVLDVGCGNGEYLLRLKSVGWECQGVELSPNAAEVGRSLGLDIYCGDLANAGFDDDAFDVVTAHHLIEHTADPQALLAQMARVTRPGGTVIVRTPDSASLGRRWLGVNWYANDVPRHLYLFSSDNLQKLAERCGLELEELLRPVKPKLLLRSLALRRTGHSQIGGKGLKTAVLSGLYRALCRLTGRGDELFAVYRKP